MPMVKKPLAIDHVTTVVPDIERATSVLRDVLGCEPTTQDGVPGMTVRTFRVGDGEIHVSAPKGAGPAEEFLQKHGVGFHHLALRFDDLDEAIATFAAKGIRTLGEPFEHVPGVREVFLDPRTTGGVMIQLVARA